MLPNPVRNANGANCEAIHILACWQCSIEAVAPLFSVCLSLSVLPSHRFGSLYGELARFVLRLLGYKGKAKDGTVGGVDGAQQQQQQSHPLVPALSGVGMQPGSGAGAPAWDSVWGQQ